MSYSIDFLPEVEMDILQAFHWYENKDTGLGEEFLRMFYAAAYEIKRQPEASPVLYKNFRRKLLKRFPYCLYFCLINNSIIVYGLFHTARNPQTVNNLIKKR